MFLVTKTDEFDNVQELFVRKTLLDAKACAKAREGKELTFYQAGPNYWCDMNLNWIITEEVS